MSDVIVSPNMNLPVPEVSIEPGPDYASDVNNCLGLIDQHNHAFGNGVQITPNGLNINADLTMNSTNLTAVRSTRYASQNSVLTGITDLDCTYVVAADLYYNDGMGNNVRITHNGAVAGSPGSIANLVSPASASYSPGTQTFIWQSDANTSANMDMGSIIIRQVLANAKGITISSPNSLANDYTLTLPAAPPSANSFLAVDNSGNITATIPTNQGIDQSNIALRSTGVTVVAGGIAVSPSSGAFSANAGASFPVPVTNLSVTITTLGNPVVLKIQSDGTGNFSYLQVNATNSNATASFGFYRGVTQLSNDEIQMFINGNSGLIVQTTPPGAFEYIDIVAAGTYTYTFQVTNIISNINPSAFVNFCVLTAYEMK